MPIIQVTVPLGERHEADFYPTDPKVCAATINLLPPEFMPKRILDPGAGDGAWGKVARRMIPDAHIIGVELRDVKPHPAYNEWIHGDFRMLNLDPVDYICGNLPFMIAESMLRCCFPLVKATKGIMHQLLPLDFLAGEDRRIDLWAEFPPTTVHVISLRPSFIHTGKKAGKTDGSSYAIYEWDFSKPPPPFPRLSWLSWKRLITHRQERF